MKKLIFLFLFLIMGSAAYSQTQTLPKMKFSGVLMTTPQSFIYQASPFDKVAPVDTINYDTVQYRQVDSSLTQISFTVKYSDGAFEDIWTSGPLNAAQVSFNYGRYSYDIGPVNGDFQRPWKLVIIADGDTTERVWHKTESNTFRDPIGTVQAYMGAGAYLTYLERQGWYLCDGRAIATLDSLTTSEKSALVSLLASGGSPNPNILPDMRGYFLRGADNGTGNDPDNASRGGSGAKLGSTQTNSVQSHTHSIAADAAAGAGTSVATSAGNTTTVTSNANGGNETRPKNIYVNWIIKAK